MKFSDSHEWADLKDDVAVVGITPFAQNELGEIVFVELPKKGAQLKAGQEAVVLESTKAAADIYTPLSGEVLEVNESLASSPATINHAPLGEGWLFKLKISQQIEYQSLMDENAYKKFIEE